MIFENNWNILLYLRKNIALIFLLLYNDRESLEGIKHYRSNTEEFKMRDFLSIEELWFENAKDENNFIVNFEGDLHRIGEGVCFFDSCMSFYDGKIDTEFESIDDMHKVVVKSNKHTGIKVRSEYSFYGDVVKQQNSVTNLNDDEKNLTYFSSAMLSIPAGGIISWNDARRFNIYLCTMGWSTENQWKKFSLEQLGIVPMRKRDGGTLYRHTLRSEGSWSTGRYYPIIIVEDNEKGVTYFMEHEGAVSWEINLGMGFFTQPEKLCIECTGADIHHDGFLKKMKKGESYTATAAVYGKVSGGFEAAVAALTDYKRKTSVRCWGNGIPPICFNVFMGAVYSAVNGKNIPSLITAAGELGCEIFCIDSGWFGGSGRGSHGDYIPNDEKFGMYTLADIIAMIKEKNMVPGLWFEFEASNSEAFCIKLHNDTVLKRYGRIISEPRGFYDLSDNCVREHILKAVDNAYDMGVRYIKNDYNQSTGIGFGEHGEDFNENNRKNSEAVYAFVDEIYRRHPDMIIENCGSGAMREDNGTLSHFHLQSTSDQEMYYNYPSIAASAMSLMPPEKAANWAYPYFLGEDEYKDFDTGENTDFLIERNADGEETTFAMVNGMLGVLYMSGRIDYLDEKNKLLVKKGIDTYKNIRSFIPTAHAIYPTGFGTVGKREFVTVGLTDCEISKIYLAVWKVDAQNDDTVIDMAPYIKGNASVSLIYPDNDVKCKYNYAASTKKLTVKLEGNKYMARLFEINCI